MPAEPAAARAAVRLLIVDDDPAHVAAIRRVLADSDDTWVCSEADSLGAFREALASGPPDIALLDLNLPDGKALEVLAAPPAAAAFPKVVMTSFGNEEAAVACLKAGAIDYVVKSPQAFATMARTLGRALREWRLLRERESASQEIRRLNAELERRVAERTAQLEAANHELEAFAYSVSHDLRAPLRAVEGFSGVLAEEHAAALDPEGRRLLEIVRRNVRRMDQLITDLLALSRVSRGEIRSVPFDMGALVAEVWNDTASASERAAVSFSIGELPPGCGDPVLIRQVCANLLGNAVKYTAPKAERCIRVEGRAEETRLVYEVHDNGVGFDPAYSRKLFGVFQRLHPAEQFEGTGVGLAIVQRIVRRHGGDVSASGHPGSGAVFGFWLPRPS